VAEAAVQFDRINGTIARLERELEKSRATIAEMAEEASRTRRFEAFEETLKNSRDYKISDLQRCCKDIKSRLDTIEGDKTTFLGLPFKSFEPINRKLGELGALQMQVDRAEAAVRRNEALFFGALAVAAAALASHYIF
jgi:chromosome segregation ATPase